MEDANGFYGTPIPEPAAPPAQDYQPQPEHQQQEPTSFWDTPPAPQVQVEGAPQVAPEPQPQPEPQPEVQLPPDVMQRLESLQQQVNQRDAKDRQAQQAWNAMQQRAAEQQAYDQQQAALEKVYEQAQYLPQDEAMNFVRSKTSEVMGWYQNRIDTIRTQVQQEARQTLDTVLRQATAPVWMNRLLQENNLPAEYSQYLQNADPSAMEYIVPALKALHDVSSQTKQQMQQVSASNFNAAQRQHGVNAVAGATGASSPSYEAGSRAHLDAILADF